MKRIIVIGVLVLAGCGMIQERSRDSYAPTSSEVAPSVARPAAAQNRFKCDGRQYCSQMTSRAEAVYFLRHCPNTKMDGDRDGIPCEGDSRF